MNASGGSAAMTTPTMGTASPARAAPVALNRERSRSLQHERQHVSDSNMAGVRQKWGIAGSQAHVSQKRGACSVAMDAALKRVLIIAAPRRPPAPAR
jgi:hypothetical protein